MPVKPVFDLRAILPVLIMFVVTAVETVGDISGVMEGGLGREATDTELSGGVMCDGLGSSFAALFGVLPNTSFSQNVGLVSMTKIVNRFALSTGAIFLIFAYAAASSFFSLGRRIFNTIATSAWRVTTTRCEKRPSVTVSARHIRGCPSKSAISLLPPKRFPSPDAIMTQPRFWLIGLICIVYSPF